MALQHQPFLMTCFKSLQSQHMYDSRFHVSFICSNRVRGVGGDRDREREIEIERESERERVFCVFDSIFTVTLPLYKLQSFRTHSVAQFEVSRRMFDCDLIRT
jgi:hypothetical protein